MTFVTFFLFYVLNIAPHVSSCVWALGAWIQILANFSLVRLMQTFSRIFTKKWGSMYLVSKSHLLAAPCTVYEAPANLSLANIQPKHSWSKGRLSTPVFPWNRTRGLTPHSSFRFHGSGQNVCFSSRHWDHQLRCASPCPSTCACKRTSLVLWANPLQFFFYELK